MEKQMIDPKDYTKTIATARKGGGTQVQTPWWARLKAEIARRAKQIQKRRPTNS
jgi:hypothetical protein